jgi:hypothetical protein
MSKVGRLWATEIGLSNVRGASPGSSGPCVARCTTSTSNVALSFSNLLCRVRSSPQAQQTSSTPARHGLPRSIVRPIKNFSSAAKPPVSPLGMTAVTEQKITVARIEKAVQLLWRTRFSNRLPRAVTRGTHWSWINGPWSSEKSHDHFVEGAEGR